jgi:putative Mg2+ transporter-C (MgtC) family protein
MHIDHLSILLRVLAAIVCGALLGAEREFKGRDAGLKSHASLSVACCLAILVSAFGFSDAVTLGLISLDPSRIAAGVEGGIGFACAAVIWRSRSKVIGLTTAINIWATANIGMACGSGMFFAAAVITGTMLFIHMIIGPAERRLFTHHSGCTMTLRAKPGAQSLLAQLDRSVAACGATLMTIHVTQAESDQVNTIEIELGKGATSVYLRLLDALKKLDGVSEVSCSGLGSAE